MKPDVWVVWPTVHLEQTKVQIEKWRNMGYRTAVLINPPHSEEDPCLDDAEIISVQVDWKGFPLAMNQLCAIVLECSAADVVVTVGDDIDPDPNHTAQELGERFIERFPDLNGVIQPTGDKFASIEKCAVSPWLGRNFILYAYGGQGPYREEYFHYFSDQELQEYAESRNIFEQWPDITQYHAHWQRMKGEKRPEHLMEALDHHGPDKKTFERRKRKGWPWA